MSSSQSITQSVNIQLEIKKQVAQIKSELNILSQGSDIQRLTDKIVEWYSQPSHRVIKLMCYPLLKSLYEFDYQTVFSIIEADLISSDDEIQLNAMKILYQMPPHLALEVLKNKEKEFLKILKNPEFNYERLVCLHDFLIKAYIKNYNQESQDDCLTQIIDMYIKIAEQVFSANRDITRDSIEIFLNIYQDYFENCSNFNSIDNYFDGNGDLKVILKPLVLKITNFFLPKIEILLSKVLSFELRLKSHLITLIVFCLKCVFEFSQEFFMYGNDSIKSSFIQEKYLVKVKGSSESLNLKEFYEALVETHLIQNILKTNQEIEIHHYPYRKELNIILMNILVQSMGLVPSYKVCVSMKVLETASKSIDSQFYRFLTMMICFYNLIDASLHLLSMKKKTCLYSLFYQPWILQIKKSKQQDNKQFQGSLQDGMNNNPLLISQELMTTLIVATIYGKIHMKNTKYFNEILQEVLDISYSIINWKYADQVISNNDNLSKTVLFAIDIYLILLEESISLLEPQQLNIRLVEIIKLINTNQISFFPKIKTLYVICKNFDQYSLVEKIEFFQILADFRQFMIQPVGSSIFTKQIEPETYSQQVGGFVRDLENIFIILFYMNNKFHSQENNLNSLIGDLVLDFKQYLNDLYSQNRLCDRNLINAVQDYIQVFELYIKNDNEQELEDELTDIQQIHINQEFLDLNQEQSNTAHLQPIDQEPRDLLYIAFNILSQGICKQKMVFETDTIEHENPILNLKSLYVQIQQDQTMNSQYQKEEHPVLITGITDFIQIYASHATFIYKSLLSVNLSIVNTAPFKIDNLKIVVQYTHGVDVFPINSNPRSILIEELNSLQTKHISFSLNVINVEPLYFSFGIYLQDNKEIEIRTIPYKISVLNFILPNYINILSKQVFHYVWNDISNVFSVQCKLNAVFFDFWKLLKQKPFSCVILEGNNQQEGNLMVSIHNSRRQSIVSTIDVLTVGMLGVTWDGVTIALNITGIMTNKQGVVTLEVKSAKKDLLEKIKSELDDFLYELTEGVLIQIN